jgi:hypothetical protein
VQLRLTRPRLISEQSHPAGVQHNPFANVEGPFAIEMTGRNYLLAAPSS